MCKAADVAASHASVGRCIVALKRLRATAPALRAAKRRRVAAEAQAARLAAARREGSGEEDDGNKSDEDDSDGARCESIPSEDDTQDDGHGLGQGTGQQLTQKDCDDDEEEEEEERRGLLESCGERSTDEMGEELAV